MPPPSRNADCHPDRRHIARGLCFPCYKRQWRASKPPKPRRITILDRAISLVSATEVGCVLWPGHVGPDGYALSWDPSRKAAGRMSAAHRMVYERLVGPIPNGMELDHLCRNRACVNPDHLEPVSPRENVRRSTSFIADNMRKTTCPNGHPYDFVDSRGHRRCRVCIKARRRVRVVA